MDDSANINLLYTANLRGDLELLPKMYTFIKALRGELSPTVLVDLGNSCAEDLWHCDATEGRSMLIAFDSMGYTAANASHLSTESRERLTEQTALALIDLEHQHAERDLLFALHPTSGDGHVCVVLTPSETTRLDGYTLYLQAVNAGEIGVVRLKTGESAELLSAEIRLLPNGTAPAATIAGVVDFILAEARYYHKRKSEKS
jgi:hypothetical protein